MDGMTQQTVLIMSFVLACWFGQSEGNCLPCACSNKYMPDLRKYMFMADCKERELNQVPSGLPQRIEYLDLSGNKLSKISQQDLQFPGLTVLSLAENKLIALPADVFQNVTELAYLDLGGNRFIDIPGELFTYTPSIRKIIGLHTVITPQELFHPANKLKILSFVAEDSVLSSMLFQDVAPNELDVSFTNVQALPLNLFSSGSTTLQQIKLTGQNLTFLDQDLFANLSLLEHIHLNVEGINELPLHLFHGTHDNLDKQLEGLKNIPIEYREVIKNNIMKSLQTKKTRLREIVVEGVDHINSHLFHYLVNLETLVIKKAKSVDPKTFHSLSRLDKLEVSYTNLTRVDSLWFQDIVGLKSLNLSHNSLSNIRDAGFSSLHSLDTLDLSANNIRVINSEDLDAFRHYLKYIDFSFNDLEHLPSGILAETYALQEVRLQDNRIKELSEQHFTDAEYIDSTNFYDYQQNLLQKELNNFDMSNNTLETINLNFFLHMGSIQVLNLANNNIVNVSISVFPQDIPIVRTDLTNNPVFCSCEFLSFVELSRRSKGEVLGVCDAPASLHGTPFKDVTIPEECLEFIIEVTTEESFTTVDDITTLGLEEGVTTESYVPNALDETANFDVDYNTDFQEDDNFTNNTVIYPETTDTEFFSNTTVQAETEVTTSHNTSNYFEEENSYFVSEDSYSNGTTSRVEFNAELDQDVVLEISSGSSGEDSMVYGAVDYRDDEVLSSGEDIASSGEDANGGLINDGEIDQGAGVMRSADNSHGPTWKWIGVGVGAVSGVAAVPAFAWFIVKMRGYLYKRNYFTSEKKGKNLV